MTSELDKKDKEQQPKKKEKKNIIKTPKIKKETIKNVSIKSPKSVELLESKKPLNTHITYIPDEIKDLLVEYEEPKKVVSTAPCIAYVDGSFNPATGNYGYGVLVLQGDKEYTLSGAGTNEDAASMRNVAGEIEAAERAIHMAWKLGAKEVLIYYDYMGIEKWGTLEWKRNKKHTEEYANYVTAMRKKINIKFEHVPAHTGIDGNERVDQLAKAGCGVI